MTNSSTVDISKSTESSYQDVNIEFAHNVYLVVNDNKVNTLHLIKFANCHALMNLFDPFSRIYTHVLYSQLRVFVSINKHELYVIK